MTIDFSSFTKNSFEGEEAKIVSILERARSSAMANIFDRAHGVCYDSAQHNYVIFKGNSCTSTNSELIPANTSVSENTGTVFPAFVFSRLTGNTTAGTIHITDGVKSADIVINAEGAID
ncbi:MAG TPA: GspH/FimT family pseudopilin [Candidatus Paceibacterota bacterium]|nr:GspH/FimT family pseudopilin [Candidatus Paceibacterota bacterium]